ncbi:EAL domain-containing protein [Ureibacillus sp. FSL K6-8385]|uniref:EAL domain-containing protein n=1 Tax=Ureibacillus terrenus TaxID=118246 RepID=A0A540V6Z8_9BACL|nr:GGDEF domain-containing phosphodiesterase [Ureibacillus terrenus]MED3661140.1 EAL domain-containing protein [Ureibacillus terrenus]MED3764382.1 EAL domain-containing protein [Ureibacillus terrenus]TQE91943.1 EAL domain-containing protein [Ureibacillus terrenus]
MNVDILQSYEENLLLKAPFPSFALNQDGQVAIWNSICEQYFGYAIQDFQTPGSLKEQLLSTLSENTWKRILDAQECFRINHIQLTHKNETLSKADLIIIPCMINNEPCIAFYCLPEERFSILGESEQELYDLKNGLFSTFMMITLDHEGFIINCNPLFLKTSKWTPKRVLRKNFWQMFPENEESRQIADTIWNSINNGKIWQGDVQKIKKTGETYWVHLTAIPTYSHNEQQYRFILIEQDITHEKELQQKLEKIAYVDTETGLMNVHRLEEIVKEMIAEQQHFYFVYLSIDKFYTLKELHNVEIENNFILEFSKRLKIYFQDSVLARINESDFVVITPLGEWFIQGFLTYLKQNPIYIGNRAMPITVSGGITRSPQDQSNFIQLMNASLETIAQVRKAGGDNILSLSEADHKKLNRKSIIEKRLLTALDQHHLKVLYQPQADLKTGKIDAVEALVRWDDKEIGVVSPDELIPIAEETGLINQIGSFIIEEACRQAVAWQQQGIEMKVGINLSVREFRDKNMAKFILETLMKTGCPAHLIQIEITEKFALEAEAETSIIQQMRTLEEEGITFVLDDFGTGYASFRYMQLLPIQTLKIDQMYIRSLTQSEKTQRLINGIVHFGKSMNLTVIAEGVETEEQKQLLKQYGCDAIQGFFISKPVTAEKIPQLISS